MIPIRPAVLVGSLFALGLCAASTGAADAAATTESIESRTAEANGVKLHYLTAGHGPAVHWLMEERPEETMDALVKFLGAP